MRWGVGGSSSGGSSSNGGSTGNARCKRDAEWLVSAF
jgi:hypothetical protein